MAVDERLDRKLLDTISARVDDATLAEIDEYQRQREREARTPLSRSLAVREILESWADERRGEASKTSETK
jgi:hypothetical protein